MNDSPSQCYSCRSGWHSDCQKIDDLGDPCDCACHPETFSADERYALRVFFLAAWRSAK